MAIHGVIKVSSGLCLVALLASVSIPVQAVPPQHPDRLSPSSGQYQYQVYLGGVSKNHAQCSVVPNLYSPANGSRVSTSTPTLIFDGGSRHQANATWLQFDISQDPDFADYYDFYPLYFQPAQHDWVYQVAPEDAMEPGTYY